jgi:hypothetical protein
VVHVRLRSSARGRWTQGKTYGSAAAVLDARYRGTRAGLSPDVAAPAQDRQPVLARRMAAVAGFARHPGQFVWQAGWHVGHRSHRRRLS